MYKYSHEYIYIYVYHVFIYTHSDVEPSCNSSSSQRAGPPSAPTDMDRDVPSIINVSCHDHTYQHVHLFENAGAAAAAQRP